MVKKQTRRQRDIKSKLLAAICMLLVSSIMMVSSTYAWFTLSTAPEVTGITTAVGANGNLEIALLPTNGQTSSITTSAGDSVKDDLLRNVTWGNLVDLSNSTVYGLDQITLYPSQLNAATKDASGNPLTISTGAILETPAYGADGRISQLNANTTTASFDSQTKSFTPSTNEIYGVRAVGTASGMTDRQLSYRNARATANSAKAQAATLASQSLNNNGSALANIAIARGTKGTDATFVQKDVNSLKAIVNDLQKDGGILDTLETAYMQYILAYAASAQTGTEDTVWSAVKNLVEGENASLTSVVNGLTSAGLTLPAALSNAISGLQTTAKNVSDANTALVALTPDADNNYTWSQLSEILRLLADPDKMLVNNIDASKIMDGNNMSTLVSDVTAGNGIVVTMKTGGGVYADVADHCGDYTASVSIEKVEYGGLAFGPVAARMNTQSSLNPNYYLTAVGTAVETAGAPASGATGSVPISDMFGYIIDMAFRTNAADSNLLLQVDAVDRIYSTNETGAEITGTDGVTETTMGGGSSMTFAATTTDFTNAQILELMKAIRIVFFKPDGSNTVVATAKLNVNGATIGTDGITAKMYLYELKASNGTETVYYTKTSNVTGQTIYTDADGQALFTVTVSGEGDSTTTTYAGPDGITPLYKDGGTTEYTEDEYLALRVENTTANNVTETAVDGNVIMALNQNTATALSVLVYLDGNEVGNEDVAATASTSMKGTMNLQFASSATLVPMNYTPLQTNQTGTNSSTTTTTTSYTVSASVPADSGITLSSSSKTDGTEDYVFTLIGTDADKTYTVAYKVGDGADTSLTATDGTYTIPMANITGNITVTVAEETNP